MSRYSGGMARYLLFRVTGAVVVVSVLSILRATGVLG